MDKIRKFFRDFSNVFTQCSSMEPLPKKLDFCHVKARSSPYPSSDIKRFVVPDGKVDWSVDYEAYNPVQYTAPSVLKGPDWADPDFSESSSPKLAFNTIDGPVNRKSFTGQYAIENKVPLNPCGRTGMKGRGLLGKWGPNHAADPIVTRWKREENGEIVKHRKTACPILEFVAIQRKDTKEWAIPGGMVDANENVSLTLKREFGEEALNSLEGSEESKKEIRSQIAKLFTAGNMIFKGYVDDPRNTDNAWMESVAVNFHDETGQSAGALPLHAGDDAGAVCWMDLDSSQKLYASHSLMLEQVANKFKAHW